MISVSDDFQCQVVRLLAHKRRLFKLLHIGNDADYSLEKRIEKWKKLRIFSGKGLSKLMYLLPGIVFWNCHKVFSSCFLGFLCWVLLFCIAHPFSEPFIKQPLCLHSMVGHMCSYLGSGAHIPSPCHENEVKQSESKAPSYRVDFDGILDILNSKCRLYIFQKTETKEDN